MRSFLHLLHNLLFCPALLTIMWVEGTQLLTIMWVEGKQLLTIMWVEGKQRI
jgi:hypothetical protein